MTTPTLPRPAERTYLERLEDRLNAEPENEIARRLWVDLYYAAEFAAEFETGCVMSDDDVPATSWDIGECGCRVTEEEAADAFRLTLNLKSGIRKAAGDHSPLTAELVAMAREATLRLALIREGDARADVEGLIDSLREDLPL